MSRGRLLHGIATALIVLIFAVAVGGPAQGDQLRIGLIDPINGYGLPPGFVTELQKRLSAVNDSGALGNAIHLARCDDQLYSVQEHSVEGACGRPVQLPRVWEIGPGVSLYRGVATGPDRPRSDSRQKMIRQPPGEWAQWRRLVEREFPNDVVARIDNRGNLHVAYDWNADLRIDANETFKISAAAGDRPHLFQVDETVLMMQSVRDLSENSPAFIKVNCWTITGSFRDRDRSWGSSLLAFLLGEAAERSDIELVWLDVNGLMPADLAASMDAAKRLECDVVFLNAKLSGSHVTDMTQLLAKLSHETGIPVAVNRRTTVSPDFLIHPKRITVPDVLEFRFGNDLGTQDAFERVARALLSDPRAMQEVVREKPAVERSARSESLFDDAEGEIGFERFTSIGNTDFVVARVPLNAVDGRLRLDGLERPISLTRATSIKLYDVRGRRVSGDDHGNGVIGDRAPPMEVPLSRGGYVVAPKKFFWMGKTSDLTDAECRLLWTRGGNPISELTHQRVVQPLTIRVTSRDELPETVELSIGMRLAKLAMRAEADVPDTVRQAASHLLERGPFVRSWWYRAAPRSGAIDYRPVFQEVGDQLPPWDDSYLQYWTFLESGWLREQSDRMGDPGLSTPQTAWILVQGVAPPSSHREPPRLVQSLGTPDHRSAQSWARTFHETRVANPESPSVNKVWVDEFQGSMSTTKSDGAEIWWGSLHASGRLLDTGDRGPAIHWVRSRGEVKSPAVKSPAVDRDWLWHYDHDPADELLQQRLLTGLTPAEILSRTVQPSGASDDLIAWRSYLLALDHPALRKQHLNRVVAASDKVLQRCKIELGGLPAPEDPYRRELDAAAGSGAPSRSGAGRSIEARPPSFVMPTTPLRIQAYAWAADAAYRKVRAIGYRELPDVISKQPITDWDVQNHEFDSAFKQLCGIVTIKDPRFALTLVRYERRRGQTSRAYDVLWRNAYEGPAMQWYFKKERDLWGDAGWEPLRRLGHARWFLRQANQPVMH